MGNKRKKEQDETDDERGGPSKKRKIEEEDLKPAPEPSPALKDLTSIDESGDEVDKLQLLVSAFSNAQQDQYEIFRRSTFPKAAIKKIMQSVSGASVPQNAVIAMAGIAKVYVGEIVEEACAAREERGEEGPLQPKHVREAVRRLKNSHKVPNSRYKRVFPFN